MFASKPVQKHYVFIMDNAKQHVAKAVKQELLQYYNI